jgi:hypothetical protein
MGKEILEKIMDIVFKMLIHAFAWNKDGNGGGILFCVTSGNSLVEAFIE